MGEWNLSWSLHKSATNARPQPPRNSGANGGTNGHPRAARRHSDARWPEAGGHPVNDPWADLWGMQPGPSQQNGSLDPRQSAHERALQGKYWRERLRKRGLPEAGAPTSDRPRGAPRRLLTRSGGVRRGAGHCFFLLLEHWVRHVPQLVGVQPGETIDWKTVRPRPAGASSPMPASTSHGARPELTSCLATALPCPSPLALRLAPLSSLATAPPSSRPGPRLLRRLLLTTTPWRSPPPRQVPGFPQLIKAFLLEMKQRPVHVWPESMRSCVCALVQHNRQLTQVFARILLARVSANHLVRRAKAPTVVESGSGPPPTLRLTSSAPVSVQRPTVAALKQLAQLMDVTADEPLPLTFDFELLLQPLRLTVKSQHFKVRTTLAARGPRARTLLAPTRTGAALVQVGACALIFVYNHVDKLGEPSRLEMLQWLHSRFAWFGLHWSRVVRSIFLHIVVMKVPPAHCDRPSHTRSPRARPVRSTDPAGCAAAGAALRPRAEPRAAPAHARRRPRLVSLRVGHLRAD